LELGLAGSVSLAAFLMYWLFQKSIWSTPDPVKAVGLMIAIVFGLHSMTEFPLWHGPSLFAFCVSIALIETSPVLQIKTKPKVLLSWGLPESLARDMIVDLTNLIFLIP
jgi:hypothetical protein